LEAGIACLLNKTPKRLVFLRILKKKQTSDGTNVVKKITAALSTFLCPSVYAL